MVVMDKEEVGLVLLEDQVDLVGVVAELVRICSVALTGPNGLRLRLVEF